MDETFSALRKGLLEFIVLKIVSGRKVYAADIISRLATTDFATGEGTLYPLLSRLRREKIVDYEWVESISGPPRKYYLLTARGRERLAALENHWEHINQTLKNMGDSK